MATEFPVSMHVVLEPVGQPWVNIDVDGWGSTEKLTAAKKFHFDFDAVDRCELRITHFKKADHDPTTAVIVKEIGFYDITDPKFVWAGVYVPDYPSHYADKVSPLPGHSYLGWNGVYSLQFSVPVFTWIHQTLSMGWLYQ
jgi:hypothetical protein